MVASDKATSLKYVEKKLFVKLMLLIIVRVIWLFVFLQKIERKSLRSSTKGGKLFCLSCNCVADNVRRCIVSSDNNKYYSALYSYINNDNE